MVNFQLQCKLEHSNFRKPPVDGMGKNQSIALRRAFAQIGSHSQNHNQHQRDVPETVFGTHQNINVIER